MDEEYDGRFKCVYGEDEASRPSLVSSRSGKIKVLIDKSATEDESLAVCPDESKIRFRIMLRNQSEGSLMRIETVLRRALRLYVDIDGLCKSIGVHKAFMHRRS